jgi:predicted MFS family arabinose efflux permease
MEQILTGVSVGVIMIAANLIIGAIKDRRGQGKAAICLLMKCNLVVLSALQKSGIINGDCDEVKGELEDFLIKRKF